VICFFDEGELTVKVLFLRDGAEKQQQMEALYFFSHVQMSKVITEYDVAMENVATAIKHTLEFMLKDELINSEATDEEEEKSLDKIDITSNAKPDAVVEFVAELSKTRGRPKLIPPLPPPEGPPRRGPARQSKTEKEGVVAVVSEVVVQSSDSEVSSAKTTKKKYVGRKSVKAEKKTGMCFKYILKQHFDCKTNKEMAAVLPASKAKGKPGVKISDLTSKFLANF